MSAHKTKSILEIVKPAQLLDVITKVCLEESVIKVYYKELDCVVVKKSVVLCLGFIFTD